MGSMPKKLLIPIIGFTSRATIVIIESKSFFWAYLLNTVQIACINHEPLVVLRQE